MKARNILLGAGLLIAGGAFLLYRRKAEAASAPPVIAPNQVIPASETVKELVKTVEQGSIYIPQITMQSKTAPAIETVLQPPSEPITVKDTTPTSEAFQEALLVPEIIPIATSPTSFKTATTGTLTYFKPQLYIP